jgi:hypothetical protein
VTSPRLFGPDFVGRTLVLGPADDPIGAWVYRDLDTTVAELWWSRDEPCVRMETEEGLCRIRFRGLGRLVGEVRVGDDEVLEAGYVGGLVRGRAEVAGGRVFEFYSRMDPAPGPWRGVDDIDGGGVLRATSRVGQGRVGFDVEVTPQPLYGPYVGPLLAIFGALQVVGRARPWLGLFTTFARGGMAPKHR